MTTIPSINAHILSDKQTSRIRKAKATAKPLMVHLLNSGKLIISWKLIRPSQNPEIIAVSDIRYINL